MIFHPLKSMEIFTVCRGNWLRSNVRISPLWNLSSSEYRENKKQKRDSVTRGQAELHLLTLENMKHQSSQVADYFDHSKHARLLTDEIFELSEQSNKAPEHLREIEWQSNMGRQLKWLMWRSAMSGARDPVKTTNVLSAFNNTSYRVWTHLFSFNLLTCIRSKLYKQWHL